MNAKILARLKERDREIQLLTHTQSTILWDQETYMPIKAAANRAKQVSLLQELIHERVVDDEWKTLFEQAGVDSEHTMGSEGLSDDDRSLLRQLWRRYCRASALPKKLVSQFAELSSQSQVVWRNARERSDFSLFAPNLKKIVAMVRDIADHVGWKEQRYDALLDEYEPYMLTSEVKNQFNYLEKELVSFLNELRAAPQIDNRPLSNEFNIDGQRKFGSLLCQALGYDPHRGRLDISAHPFSTTLGADDVRITTRFRERFLPTSIFGTLHELGHALYELGVDERYHGTILADGSSLGIHESQSRFWENVIGKSKEFWHCYWPKLREIYPGLFPDTDAEHFWRMVNRVEPSYIRIDADEVTYSLHIILRFNLERQMVSGELSIDDLPAAWNEQFEKMFGVTPPSDSEGVLQDVHWSHGAFGYFPTYALGNIFGAQFLQAQLQDMPDFWNMVAAGEFFPIKEWLTKNIYQWGCARTASELCQQICGEPINASYFIKYLRDKFSRVYQL